MGTAPSPLSGMVTPSLVVGDTPDVPGAIDVLDAKGALLVIRAGLIARLPERAWHSAYIVLRRLGADPVWASAQVEAARTGVWNWQEALTLVSD